MRRSGLVAGLITALLVWVTAADAQQPRMPIIGHLNGLNKALWDKRRPAFDAGLKEHGFALGRNVGIVSKFAEGRFERLPALAQELVSSDVSVLLAVAAVPAIQAAKAATSRIPIAFILTGDPVKLGLVDSLARPGANLTGVTMIINELAEKRLELVRELMPSARSIAFLVRPDAPNAKAEVSRVEPLARSLGYRTSILKAHSKDRIDAAFADASHNRFDAMMIVQESFMTSRVQQLAELSIRYQLPAVYGLREYAVSGGLVSYGSSIDDHFRLLGSYVGRILRGAKPSDLPVQQSSKFELVINLKTAKVLGITVPPTLLGRADEVIE